jgi:hypothetical protein
VRQGGVLRRWFGGGYGPLRKRQAAGLLDVAGEGFLEPFEEATVGMLRREAR